MCYWICIDFNGYVLVGVFMWLLCVFFVGGFCIFCVCVKVLLNGFCVVCIWLCCICCCLLLCIIWCGVVFGCVSIFSVGMSVMCFICILVVS